MTLYYGGLFIDRLKVSRLRDGVSDRLLAAFTDNAYRPNEQSKGKYWEWDPDEDDYNEPQIVHQWVSKASDVADRLDALGAREQGLRSLVVDASRHLADVRRSWANDPTKAMVPPPEGNDELIAYLEQLTLEKWVTFIQNVHQLDEALDLTRPGVRLGDVPELGPLAEVLGLVAYWPEEYVLRIYCVAFPDAQVRLDLTEMIEDQSDEEIGPEVLCSHSRAFLAEEAAINSSTVVLLEGKSDARALQDALRVIAPHLFDVVRVMDFEKKVEGGAGALASIVRAFAAAGISNRVVAIFDNDTAAFEAISSLSTTTLPGNIFLRQLPPLDFLSSYPTIGPIPAPDGGSALFDADVNGLAGSLELYFGADVLLQENGTMTPVQWTSYMAKARRYQGEVLEKAKLQERFQRKCHEALAGNSLSEFDWTGMSAVIETIKSALR